MRATDLERPFTGIRAPAGTSATMLGLCLAYRPLLRSGQYFSHLTAAMLWGCPLPKNLGGGGLHVTSTAPTRAPEGKGVIGHQAQRGRSVERHGLPVADAATTFCQLALLLPLDELVVIGDHLVLDPRVLDPLDIRPHVDLAALAQHVQSFSGRGARAAASGLALVRQGAESRPETLLRLLLIRARLPEPELNVELRDPTGRWLGRADLVYREWMVIVEYDGDQHRTDSAQYEKDMTRIEGFLHAKWTVVRVRKDGLFVHPAATVARVTHALAENGWHPEPDPS